MPVLKNDRLLRTIRREPVDMTPVWIMRQAGRYLPEYQATRARAGSFMALCTTPDLACEVSLQPIQRYPLDAAIIFSDILTIPDALGLGLHFVENKGPQFKHPIRCAADIKRLELSRLEQLNYVYDAIKLTLYEVAGRVPLIGFCGSPWTLAVYMIEGEAKPHFPQAQKMLNEEPRLLHNLLDILSKSVSIHLQRQVAAGAQVVMLFDTWGGLLSAINYQQFSLLYLKQAILEFKSYNNDKIPVILFSRNSGECLEDISNHSGCDVIGIDWQVSLKDARKRIGEKIGLQGNMNPAHLLTSPEQIQQEVLRVLDSFGHGSGHIFNLGHGITPDVPPEHVAVLIDAVHDLSKSYHALKSDST